MCHIQQIGPVVKESTAILLSSIYDSIGYKWTFWLCRFYVIHTAYMRNPISMLPMQHYLNRSSTLHGGSSLRSDWMQFMTRVIFSQNEISINVLFLHEMSFQNVVCYTMSILPRPRCDSNVQQTASVPIIAWCRTCKKTLSDHMST